MLIWLIYFIITKTIIECAPKPEDMLNNSLKINTTKLDNEPQSVYVYKLTEKVATGSNVVQNIIKHKEDIIEAKNKINDTQTMKYFESTVKSVAAKPDNEMAKSNSKTQNFSILSEENEISDIDASDWLDPEIEAKTVTKRDQITNLAEVQTSQDTKICNTCTGEAQYTTKKKNVETNKQISPKPQNGNTIKIEKIQDTQSPQKIIMKILRNSYGDMDDQRILVDGYDYNINMCRFSGSRYLCGYNKNIGKVKDSVEIEQVGNGCIIRGDRMECGYKDGPWSVNFPIQQLNAEIIASPDPQSIGMQTMQLVKNDNSTISDRVPDTPTVSTSLPNERQNLRKACYEQNDRIICYDIPF